MRQVQFIIVMLLLALRVCAGNNVLINGRFTARAFKDIPLTELGLHDANDKTTDLTAAVDNKGMFRFAFTIDHAGFYRLGDGLFGHIVFIEPDDTISIILTPYPEKEIMSGVPFHRAFNKMTVQAKRPAEVFFFDAMDKLTMFPVKFKLGKETAQQFKNRCDTALAVAFRLLNRYAARQQVSDTFQYYARAEINAQYILNLCNCLYFIPKDKLPGNFFNRIPIQDFNDENIAGKTDSYITAVSVYNVYVANDFDTHRQDYTNLTGEFSWACQHLSGLIRDRITAWMIDDYKDKGMADYDSVYQVFLQKCQSAALKNWAVAKVAHYKESEKMQAVSFMEVMRTTKVVNVKGDTMSLASALSNTAISVIDFWATWCKPCLASKPDFEKAAEKYKGKLSFISISTDSDADKWKHFPKNSAAISDYYLVNNFTSPLILYLKVEFIPRFVSISKSEAKVIDSNMVRPQFKADFDKALASYIQ